jgi:hypothetical protein
MTTRKRVEVRVTTLMSSRIAQTKHMQGGRQKAEDGMVVVRGREVFDVVQNGGTEVLDAHTYVEL